MNDFDLLHQRLINWGRWGMQDACKPSPIPVKAGHWEMWDPTDDWSNGWGDPIPYMRTPTIDEWDASYIDTFVRILPDNHLKIVKARFYPPAWAWTRREDLDAALRALMDLVEPERLAA